MDKNSIQILSFSQSPANLAENIFAIIQNALPDSWNLTTLKNLLAQDHSFGFTAMDGNIAVGFIAGHLIPGETEILSFGVLKKYQGQGIGEDLLQKFLNESRAKGTTRVLLDVAEDSLAAITLYQKYQFEIFGRRERYYARDGQNRVDALLMALSLVK